jgi:uncharacterized hydrophobic protein (TIGR00271 family)
MFSLRAFADPEHADDTIAILRGHAGVRHIVLEGTTADSGKASISAEVEPAAVDEVLAALVTRGLLIEDLTISRLEIAHPLGPDGTVAAAPDASDSLVWTQVADEAIENVVLRPTYLAYMAVAGIIAATGVIDSSAILVIGAMAVSPDLLPVSAACVALVGRRPRLLGRAAMTLFPGLAIAIAAALLLTLFLRLVDYIPHDFALERSGLSQLASVGWETVIVALAAGVAAMLSFETRASFAVGVAISVTTIPAAGFMGVAAGLGQWSAVGKAGEVLGVNILLLMFAGTATLAVQWRLRRRPPPMRHTAA